MNIKLYEKKEALEVIILGINKDPYRVNFHHYLDCLDLNVDKQDLADSSPHTIIIEKDGVKTEFDHYLNIQELAEYFSVSEDVFSDVNYESGLLQAANTTRIGNCCGVGEDIYVDPNEEN